MRTAGDNPSISWLPWLLLSIILSAGSCHAILVNYTIDDAYPDPRTGVFFTYTPSAVWQDGRDRCDECAAKPSQEFLHNRTWHDSTFRRSRQFANVPRLATATFDGVAIYVYVALARTNPGLGSFTDLTFFIDGEQVGTLTKTPPSIPGYDYNVIVYQNTSLSPGNHEFVLQNGRVNGPDSLVLFDRIIYTYEDGTAPEGSKNRNLGAILGATLGGVAALCILAVLGVFLYLKKRPQQAGKEAHILEEFQAGGHPGYIQGPNHPNGWAPAYIPQVMTSSSSIAVGTPTHWDPSRILPGHPSTASATVSHYSDPLPEYYEGNSQPQVNLYRKTRQP